MKEDYVSFELAKLLKEKGFDWGCYKVYNTEGVVGISTVIEDVPTNYKNRDYYFLCPTIQMAMKYLREVHNLFIEIHFWQDTYEDVCCEVGWKEPTYNYRIIGIGNNDADHVDIDFNSYESACESAIEYCLTNLI